MENVGGGDLQLQSSAILAKPLPRAIVLPTPAEQQAWQLRQKGFSDGSIKDLVGAARETVNRRINRYERKVKTIREMCGGDSCRLLSMLLGAA